MVTYVSSNLTGAFMQHASPTIAALADRQRRSVGIREMTDPRGPEGPEPSPFPSPEPYPPDEPWQPAGPDTRQEPV